MLTDVDIYETISRRMEQPAVQTFDRLVLTPFYQQVADAIREVDTTANNLWSSARVEVIFRHHAEVSNAHQWPMLVGEWGAFWENEEGMGYGNKPQADQLRDIFERACCGNTFWSYPDEGFRKQNLDGFGYSDAIVRGIPLAVNGLLVSYYWNPQEKTFHMLHKYPLLLA